MILCALFSLKKLDNVIREEECLYSLKTDSSKFSNSKEVHRTSFFICFIFERKRSRIKSPLMRGAILLLRPFSPIFISSERSRSVMRRTKCFKRILYDFDFLVLFPMVTKTLNNGKKNRTHRDACHSL